MRDDLKNWFGPEVEAWPEGIREIRLDALATLVDWEVWDSLQHQWGYDAARTRSILKSLTLAALSPGGEQGGQQDDAGPSNLQRHSRRSIPSK